MTLNVQSSSERELYGEPPEGWEPPGPPGLGTAIVSFVAAIIVVAMLALIASGLVWGLVSIWRAIL